MPKALASMHGTEFFKVGVREGSRMAQQVRELASMPDQLSLSPGTQVADKKTDSCKLSSDLRHVMAHVCPHTDTREINE